MSDTAQKRDVLEALRSLLAHRTEDLGCYEFVLEAWMESAAEEIERLRAANRWIPVSERLPEIAPEGVSATVIAAHVGYDLTMQGFVRAGELRSSPADYIVSDENVPGFKSMVNGRWLDVVAWMPLPAPPEVE